LIKTRNNLRYPANPAVLQCVVYLFARASIAFDTDMHVIRLCV